MYDKENYKTIDRQTMIEIGSAMNNIILNRKENIKKYLKARKLFEDIADSIIDYAFDHGNDLKNVLINAGIMKLDLNLRLTLDNHIFNDLIIYPYDKNTESLTEFYLRKHRYRKEEKIKMLEAMRDSK